MKRFSVDNRIPTVMAMLALVGSIGLVMPAAVPVVVAVVPGVISAEAKALARVNDDWSLAAAGRDAERLASYYAEEAVAYPPNQPVARGRGAAKKVWAVYFADPTFAISWKTVHAEVVGDFGYAAGTYEVSFKGPKGKMALQEGKYLRAWKKQGDGSWKAIHDMWNADAR